MFSLLYDESSPLTHGDGGMAESCARFYSAGVLAALHHLHTRSPPVLYRDLKMENVVLDGRGYPKVGQDRRWDRRGDRRWDRRWGRRWDRRWGSRNSWKEQ
jgi:hypothetical protein